MVADVYHAAGRLMEQRGKRAGVADEGGWWPDFSTNEEALQTLTLAIESAGYKHGQVSIAIDVAASEFGKQGKYTLGLDKRIYSTEEWLEVLLRWVSTYPIISVEDPFAEDDTAGMQAFTRAVGERLQVIGDDYLVTSTALIEAAVQDKACNAVLLKPNQVGTLTGWNTGQLKVGSFARSERMAKWNEALRIESSAAFSGGFAGVRGLPFAKPAR